MQSRLRAFMTRHQITRAEIAGALNLDPSAVSRKVSGARPWKLDEVQALLEFLAQRIGRRVSYDQLFAPEKGVA